MGKKEEKPAAAAEEKKEVIQPRYRRMKDMCVDLYTRDEVYQNRLLNGKALVNSEKGEVVFAQNPPRGPRSREVGRTGHGRLVRRPDGRYTFTFASMVPEERNLREQLLAEVRKMCTTMQEDRERCLREEAAAKKEGGKHED